MGVVVCPIGCSMESYVLFEEGIGLRILLHRRSFTGRGFVSCRTLILVGTSVPLTLSRRPHLRENGLVSEIVLREAISQSNKEKTSMC